MNLINPQGVFSHQVPTGNLVWVDAANGNDSLAARARLTVPFKTLGEAKEAAVAGDANTPGDTIVVMPGLYNEKNLLKDYVNWFFMPGAKVKYSETSEDGGIFDTSADGLNDTVHSIIGGYGEFEMSSGVQDHAHVVNSAAASSNLVIYARRMQATKDVLVVSASSGKLKIHVAEDMLSGADVISLSGVNPAGSVFVSANRLETSAGVCLQVDSGSIELVAQSIYASADVAIQVGGGSGTVVVRAYEIVAQYDPAVYYDAYPYGSTLSIYSSRIKSNASHAVQIVGASSNKVRFANCILLAASASYKSIHASVANTVVQFHGHSVANYGTTSVTAVPTGFLTDNTQIS